LGFRVFRVRVRVRVSVSAVRLGVLDVLLDEGLVLGVDLLLELLDLVVHDLELALHLRDLVLRFDQALRVEVAVRAHRLVEVLLLSEARLAFGDEG